MKDYTDQVLADVNKLYKTSNMFSQSLLKKAKPPGARHLKNRNSMRVNLFQSHNQSGFMSGSVEHLNMTRSANREDITLKSKIVGDLDTSGSLHRFKDASSKIEE